MDTIRITSFPTLSPSEVLPTDRFVVSRTSEDAAITSESLIEFVKTEIELQSILDRLQTLEDNLIGTIQTFASETLTEDYLLCDGAEVAKADYPKLYAKIGDVFGNTDLGYTAPSDESHFRLPDLKDQFIRNTDGTRALGTKQGDTMQKITGNFRTWNNGVSSGTNGAFTNGATWSINLNFDGGGHIGNDISFDSSKVARTDSANETRPKNVSLIFAIKAK